MYILSHYHSKIILQYNLQDNIIIYLNEIVSYKMLKGFKKMCHSFYICPQKVYSILYSFYLPVYLYERSESKGTNVDET
jgi:hypothetical protein